MKFTSVDYIPSWHRGYSRTKNMEFLEEVIASGHKTVKVDWKSGGYSSSKTCRTSLYGSIMRFGYPLTVHGIDGEIYLRRKDI